MTYIWCKSHCNECGIEFVVWVRAPHLQARELHHIYFRSQYTWSDRNQKRNIAYLCPKCHRDNNYWVHGLNKILDKKLKAWADIQKAPENRSNEKIKIIKKSPSVLTIALKEERKEISKQQRKKYVEVFKKNNNWLSPTQVAYRKRKEYYSEKLG